MRKIVLIETKSPHLHVYSKVHIPRLGSVLLGTILRDRGYEVRVYIEEIHEADMADILSADLVGISTLTSTAPRSYRIADQVRAAGIPVVLGGTHVTFLPDEGMEHADYVVRGEGEDAIVELLEAIEGRRALSSIPGLSHRSEGRVVHNPERPLREDLDILPIPDFSLVVGRTDRQVISIDTSRGCPFDCTFCSVTAFMGRGYRFKSTDRVIRELKAQDYEWVFFADDIFTANPGRTKDLLRRMIAEGLTPGWGAQVRTEAARNEELLRLMRRSGCEIVYVGMESINPRTLKLFSKRQTVEGIEEAIRRFHGEGIRIHGMFVLGSDEDTVETIGATEEFARRWDIDSVQFMILTPIPGAADYLPFATGKRPLLSRDWSLYDGHHVVFVPRRMTPYELQTETVKAMRRFYSLGSVARRALKGDLFTAGLRLYGRQLLKEWSTEHRAFLEGMREDLYGEARGLRERLGIGRIRRIAIARDPAQASVPFSWEVFFHELGVKVDHYTDDLHTLVEDGQARIARSRTWLHERLEAYLSSLRNRVDCVVLPVLSGTDSPQFRAWEEIVALSHRLSASVRDLPRVIRLPLDPAAPALDLAFIRASLVFAEDVAHVRRAYLKACQAE